VANEEIFPERGGGRGQRLDHGGRVWRDVPRELLNSSSEGLGQKKIIAEISRGAEGAEKGGRKERPTRTSQGWAAQGKERER